MRALTLVADRKLELVEVAAPAAARAGRGAGARQGGGAQPSRPVGLPRHGLRQAQAAARGRRRGRRRDRRGRPRRRRIQARRSGGHVWRAHLRHLQGLPRGPRQSVRERRRHHGLPRRRLCARSPQHAGAAGDPGSRRRRAARCRLRADRLRDRAAHAVRQRQARAGRDRAGACRRLRHRHRRDQDGEGDRRTVITTVGDDAKAEKAKALGADHVINYRTDRFEGAVRKLTGEQGRRRGVRACRRRDLQRLAAVPQARRAARHLRRDLGPLDHHQPDAALPAAVPHHRLVRRLDAQYPREPRQDGGRAAAGDRHRGRRSPTSSAALPGSKAGRCSARSSCVFEHRSRPCQGHVLGRTVALRLKALGRRRHRRAGGRALQGHPARSIPTFMSQPRRLCHAARRAAAPRASHRPRQSRRRVSREIAGRDRSDPARRLGQSRPRRRRIRPSRPAVGLRPDAQAPRPHPRFGRKPGAHLRAARRRQARAHLLGASRQLGDIGAGGARLRPRYRRALPPAEPRRRRRCGRRNCAPAAWAR